MSVLDCFFFFFGRALKPELKNICVSVVCHANPTLKVFFVVVFFCRAFEASIENFCVSSEGRIEDIWCQCWLVEQTQNWTHV